MADAPTPDPLRIDASGARGDSSSRMQRLTRTTRGLLLEREVLAERKLGLYRLLAMGAVAVFYPVLTHGGDLGRAYLVLGPAVGYALVALVALRRLQWAWRAIRELTTFCDAMVIASFVVLTGGVRSEYAVALYVAIAAAAFRRSRRETLATTAVYTALYVASLALAGELAGHGEAVGVQLFFLWTEALICGQVANDTVRQVRARAQAQQELEIARRLSRSQTQLAEAQALAHVGNWELDFATGLVTWSEEVYRIYGVEAGAFERTFDAYLARLEPHDRERVRAFTERARQARQPFSFEHRITRPNGEVRWLHGRGRPVVDEGGKVVRILGTCQDVTERIELEERLRVSDRMASLGTLAAGVAHEINNPLAYVVGNCYFIRTHAGKPGDPPPQLDVDQWEEVRQALVDLDEGAERVKRIVHDLHTFSRGDQERVGPVDVHKSLELALKMAMPQIRHQARILRDYGDVPPVQANERRLGQVFLNLIVNAAQALDNGAAAGNEIRIRTRLVANEVMVAVEDTGPGMTPDVLARVFDPFFTTKPAGVGTGLGLSICHGIVRQLGGSIQAKSEPGKGSSFEVLLPRARPSGSVSAQRPAVALPSTGRRARVLVVDDEQQLGRVVGRVLGTEHEVVHVTRADDAVSRFRAGERFDVVLCDLMMPDMTGMDLFELVRSHWPDTARRMVFMTGGAFTDRAKRFLGEVENPHLDKPVDPEALRSLVRSAVG